MSAGITDEAKDALFAVGARSAADIAIVAMDLEGRVLAMNAGAEQLLRYRESDLIGHTADVIFTPEDLAANAATDERADALATGRTEDERWHVRADGTRFWASGVMTTLPDGTGLMKFMRDLTERRRVEERLRSSEERFRILATNIPQLVFSSLGDGSRTWGSPQWVIFTGLSDHDSRGYGWLEAIHPEDRAHTRQAWDTAVQTGRYEVEHRVRRTRDSVYRWHQTVALPLAALEGEPQEWVGASTDIHQLRGLQESQHVLLSELQHRTRNLLTIVQTIVRRSARSAASLQEFIVELEHRLRALSRAESLTPYASKGVVGIRDLVDTELAAHLPRDQPSKVKVEGAPISIPRAAAQPVSLALHELATNAVKHGALHQPQAHLNISWREVDIDDERRLELIWRESLVNMAAASGERRYGYGSELIAKALPYQLGTATELAFLEDGIRCVIQVPLASREASE
jgi:PAS domain S-box-containing protein